MAKKKDMTNAELFEAIQKELEKNKASIVPVPYIPHQPVYVCHTHCTCSPLNPVYPYCSPYINCNPVLTNAVGSNNLLAGQLNTLQNTL